MKLDRLGPWRLPVVAAASIAIALAVAGAVLLLGRIAAPENGKSPTPRNTATSTAMAETGPEDAVRAFFAAFAEARETGDPELIEPFVNGTESSAYQTAAGFLRGQSEVGKGSIVTAQELTNFDVESDQESAVVLFDLVEGGYDVDLESGEPLESPVVLPLQRVRAELVRSDGGWLLDSYQAVQE